MKSAKVLTSDEIRKFDDAVKANQDRERQINEGQAYYNDVVPKAQGTSARLIQEAQGYKERVISAAEGEADRFKKILADCLIFFLQILIIFMEAYLF